MFFYNNGGPFVNIRGKKGSVFQTIWGPAHFDILQGGGISYGIAFDDGTFGFYIKEEYVSLTDFASKARCRERTAIIFEELVQATS
jgi:hypothetical protein